MYVVFPVDMKKFYYKDLEHLETQTDHFKHRPQLFEDQRQRILDFSRSETNSIRNPLLEIVSYFVAADVHYDRVPLYFVREALKHCYSTAIPCEKAVQEIADIAPK